jgi:hypothetical protein
MKNIEPRMILSWILVIALFCIIVMYAWLSLYPLNPIDVMSLKVNKTVIYRGEEVCYTLTAEKYHDVAATVNIELVNCERILIMSYAAQMPLGKLIRKRCFIVPYHVKPGFYQVNWSAVYDMNAFQSVRKDISSQRIEVK